MTNPDIIERAKEFESKFNVTVKKGRYYNQSPKGDLRSLQIRVIGFSNDENLKNKIIKKLNKQDSEYKYYKEKIKKGDFLVEGQLSNYNNNNKTKARLLLKCHKNTVDYKKFKIESTYTNGWSELLISNTVI